VLELTKTEVSSSSSLHSLTSGNTDTNIGSLDHRDIVGTITNRQHSLFGMFSFDKLNNACFLFGTDATRHNYIHDITDLCEVCFECFVFLNDGKGITCNNESQLMCAIIRSYIQVIPNFFHFFSETLNAGCNELKFNLFCIKEAT
jgi:hypothetical protein